MVYMNYVHLVRTEQETAAEFRKHFAILVDTLGDILDDMFRLPYFVEHPKGVSESYAAQHWFCFERCVHAPYTLRAIYSLCGTGYYGEATVVLRHLLEVFVQVRYFCEHPEQIKQHITATKLSQKIKFKVMFDFCAPNSYELIYGPILSNVAHGGLGLSVFVSDYKQSLEHHPVTAAVNLGCRFDERGCRFVVTQMLALTFGFLNLFPSWFPTYKTGAPEYVEERRLIACGALADYLRNPDGGFAKVKEWHALIGLVV